MKIGKANYSGTSSRKEIFKIKDGDNVYRPLPPMGDLADQGRWSMYYRICWGYKDKSGKNRPFVSPRQVNFRTKMVDVDCAAFNYSMAVKDEYQELVKEAKALSKSGEVLTDAMKEKLESLKARMMRYNIDSKHYINAIDLEGKIGLLKLGANAMKGIKALGKELEAKGVDLCGLEGRFVNIKRSGTGLDTQYTVLEHKTNVEVEIDGVKELVQRSVPHKLDDSIIARLEGEAFELDKIYPEPSEAEVAQLVAAHKKLEDESLSEEALAKLELEAAELVENILGASKSNSSSSETEAKTTSPVQEAAKEEVKQESAPVQESVKEETAPAKESVKEETFATETHVTSAANQSDEDFLASLKS